MAPEFKMSQERTLEQRLAALEREVVQLKQRLDQLAPGENWVDRVTGSMKDFPEFGEVLRLGAEIRRADRPTDET
jgi:hypothetical protein